MWTDPVTENGTRPEPAATETGTVLAELTAAGVPWLTLAAAEGGRPDSGLTSAGDTAVIDITDPQTPPVTVNPLEPETGYPVQAHADRLAGLLEAAFGLTDPVAAALRSGLRRAYAECGWDLLTGLAPPGSLAPPAVPAFRHLGPAVLAAAHDLGYDPALRATVRGFLQARLEPLWTGPAGRFLEGGHPVDSAALLGGNTLVIIGGPADDEALCFLAGVPLIRVAERLSVADGSYPARAPPAVPDNQSGPGPRLAVVLAGPLGPAVPAAGSRLAYPAAGRPARPRRPGHRHARRGPPGLGPGSGPGRPGGHGPDRWDPRPPAERPPVGRLRQPLPPRESLHRIPDPRGRPAGPRRRAGLAPALAAHPAARLPHWPAGAAGAARAARGLAGTRPAGARLPAGHRPRGGGERPGRGAAPVLRSAAPAGGAGRGGRPDARDRGRLGPTPRPAKPARHQPRTRTSPRPSGPARSRSSPQLRWLHEAERLNPLGQAEIPPGRPGPAAGLRPGRAARLARHPGAGPRWPRCGGTRCPSRPPATGRRPGPRCSARMAGTRFEADLASAAISIGPQARLNYVARAMGIGARGAEPGWLEVVLSWPGRIVGQAWDPDLEQTATG